VHHIEDALTAGGFLEYEHIHEDPRAGERVELAAADSVTGHASGWDITLRGVVYRPVSFVDPGLIASLEADTDWASGNYMQTYFDVTAPDVIRSGLPPYSASEGFKSVGAALSLDQFLSRKWSVGVRFHYARLMNDAADSPVTHIEGSPNQYFVGLVVGYVL
jgi:outer membrane scaffolding protein for murein synthesis (MipA/OmpV family)